MNSLDVQIKNFHLIEFFGANLALQIISFFLMNCLHMPFEISCKPFVTNGTFSLFGFFMHKFDVVLNRIFSFKWLVTNFTFIIILRFVIMNILDVAPKMMHQTKCLSTKVTMKIFGFAMDSFDMSIKISWLAKEFVTEITFVILISFMNIVEVLL